MISIFKSIFTVFLLFYICILQEVNSLVFRFTTQAGFNSVIATIQNYANRQYLDSIEMYAYDYRYERHVNDIRGLAILRECTYLKKFVFELGRTPNLQSGGFGTIISYVKDLQHIEHFGVTFHTCGFTDLSPLNQILTNFNKMTYFRAYFHSMGITNFNSGIASLQVATQIKEFYFSCSYNNVNTVSGFQNKLRYLNNLESLHIGMEYNNLSTIDPLKNEFVNKEKLHTFSINIVQNPVSSFSMQETFKDLVSLKSLSFNAGPTIESGIRWSNFTIVHDQIEEFTLVSREYLHNSHEIFKYLPNLKRINIRQCTIGNTSANNISINGWGSLFTAIQNKITTFEYVEDHIYKQIDINNFKNILTTSRFPNLETIKILLSRNRPERGALVVPQFNHATVKELRYQIVSFSSTQSYWSAHTGLFNNLPGLIRPKLYFTSDSLNDSDMSGYGNTMKSLQGRTFEEFELGITSNQVTNLNSLRNINQPFTVTKHALFSFNSNSFTSTSGLGSVLNSIITTDSAGLKIYLQDNQISNVSTLGNELSSYNNLKLLHLLFQNNKLVDINQFNGIFDNKPQLDDIAFWVRGNQIADQTNLGVIFDSIVYGRKPIIRQLDIDLKHPVNGENPTFKNGMEVEGEYLAVSKYGYCYSTYAMARRFVLGSNQCVACVNEFCHSCSKADVCDKCRKSEPQRQLPKCLCNIGFYDGSGSSCLECSRKCESCDNGQNCLTCVNSVPKRMGADCICPDGYYDDGINDQCGSCKTGSATCSDGMTSNSCISGYYLKGNQCLICPAEFSKCEYDQETQTIKSLQCIGENRLYLPDLNCPCIEGYYPIKFVSNCFACNPVCITCSSFKNCTECITGYYLQLNQDLVTKSCKKCSPLCKTCSQSETCDTCESRQFDPATGCTQQYVSGGSSSSGNNTNGSGNNTDSGSSGDGSSESGSNGDGSSGSGSSGSGTSGSGSSGNESSGSGSSGVGSSGSGSSGSGSSGSGSSGSGSSGSGSSGSGSSGNESSGSGSSGSESSGSGSSGDGSSGSGTSGSGSGNNGTSNENNGGTNGSNENYTEEQLAQHKVYEQQFQSQFEQQSTASFSVVNPVTNQIYEQSCNPECDSCEDLAYKCLTCHIGKNRQNQPPFCNCLEGFYDQTNSYDCLQCQSQCKTCRQKSECESCRDEDFRQLDVNRQCSCIEGYKEVRGQSQCQLCYQFQDECLLQCPSYTIQDESKKVCQTITYTYNSNLSTIIIISMLLVIFILLSKIYFTQNNKKTYEKIQNNQNQIQKMIHKNKDNMSSSKSNSLEENSPTGDQNV